MGIFDDAIQFEAWFDEVWSNGSDRGGERADAAPQYGYLDAAEGQQAIQRATNARTLITPACINGAPQRAYIPKEDVALPTVSTESTFITATIAAA